MRFIPIIFLLALAPHALAKGGASSAENRANSWGSFMLGPGLSGNEGAMGKVAVAAHVGTRIAVEGYAYSTSNFDSSLKGNGARALLFLGNSFYLAGGEEQRTITRTDGLLFATTRTRDVFKDHGIAYGLGNRWQWSGFTMGCEWLGGFARQKRDSATRTTYNVLGPNTEEKVAEEEYTATDYFRTDTRFLQFTLGVPF